jgi:hypothetical protein
MPMRGEASARIKIKGVDTTMKTALAIIVAAAVLFIPLAAQKKGDFTDPAGTYEEGWTTLFNGKDLSGLVVVLRDPADETKYQRFFGSTAGDQKTFRVEDGLLKTTGEPLGYIRTTDVYDNFVFHVEARFLKDGNSGVLFHVQKDAPLPNAIECQLYYAHIGRVFPLFGHKLEGGELIHYNAKPVGEWNTIEVYSEDGRVATLVNGALSGLGSGADPAAGHICLQSEGAPVEFRNIKVKRFTPAARLRPKK